ncbi:MAG: AAA family ATPase [Phenylobacterium sp.]|uniref:AAA family ATPase n=1 Tax=Phenylobacterium sp. TaxID=1871053 RepID=UPI00391951D0
MPPPRRRIHITGPSGAGTTTLGAALAPALGAAHLDTDAYYWEATDPPFTTPRPAAERLRRIESELHGRDAWVISGSLMGWGDALTPRFDLVIFLYVPPVLRLERLRARERSRYGAGIEPGGRMHEASRAFLDWARSYEDPSFRGRSLALHRAWLASLPCPVLSIEDAPPLEESLRRALAAAG